MAYNGSKSPWMSAPRITVLVASFLVVLGCGTNYLYSAFSPQLGARLKISHTQLNTIALAGNAGVYTSAPLWGRMVDSRGPRILLIIGFALLLGGYSGIKYLYDSGLPPDSSTLPVLGFYMLVLFNFVTGSGGMAGLTGCLNATVKSFPDGARASTTGLVMAGFGLSALFFTTIANTLLRSTTSTFLLILTLGTPSLMVLGFFLVHPIPLPPQASYQPLEDGDDIRGAILPAAEHHIDCHTPLLNNDCMKDGHARYTDNSIGGDPSNSVGRVAEVARSSDRKCNSTLDVFGKSLCHSLEFWLLFIIFSMLSGTGYTYINNVGSMSQSLYAHNNNQYDEAQALRWQAVQVSVISLTNFGGRILMGFFSDFAKRLYGTPRSHSLAVVAFFFLASQIVAANTTNISNLWIASALLGLGHGGIAAVNPTLCLEWFGLPHFSENWGYICISPIFSANLLAFLFGRIFDAHDHKIVGDLLIPSAYSQPRCLQGRDCYVDALYLTIGTTFLPFILSIWTGYRDSRRVVNGG